MKANEIDSKDSGIYAFYAARDARMRNIANASRFSDVMKIRAERMKQVLTLVYAAKAIHVNFRKTKIAVKVDAGIVRDRKNLALLEKDWEQQGVSKTLSAQGVIYSFG
jgi:hypothetical protein